VSDQQYHQTILPFQTQAILFDLDDTLHHRYHAFQNWAQAFAQMYYAPEQGAELAKMSHYLIEIDQYGYMPREEYFQRLQQRYPQVQGSTTELIQSYQQNVIDYIVLEDEIRLLLHHLQEQHVPIGIVTNGDTQQQKRKIAKLGIAQFTSCIFVSQEFGVAKPDPSIFLAAARCLDTDPERILFVGDNPAFDIWGAHQVGMRTLWIQHEPRTWPEDIPQDSADSTVHTFADLLTLLKIQPTDTSTPTTN
jgi:putative hydrolase of the HAD superfamily